ncbi:hypothetical protein E4U44_000827 [Claviceps purpurea]|nr:hypothetical protein E4U44_000827 [Claviceps purpurea]
MAGRRQSIRQRKGFNFDRFGCWIDETCALGTACEHFTCPHADWLRLPRSLKTLCEVGHDDNDNNKDSCPWDVSVWHQEVLNAHSVPNANRNKAESIIQEENLPPSFTTIGDAHYILRPEAIESVFIMYRITGDRAWQEKAWKMWKAIETMTSTVWPTALSAT